MICPSERDRVGEVLSPVRTQWHFRLVPVIGAAGDEDKVGNACPAERFHTDIAEERRIAVEQVARNTAAAPRCIGEERQARQSAKLHPPLVAHLNAVVFLSGGIVINRIAGGNVVIISGDGVTKHREREAIRVLGMGN